MPLFIVLKTIRNNAQWTVSSGDGKRFTPGTKSLSLATDGGGNAGWAFSDFAQATVSAKAKIQFSRTKSVTAKAHIRRAGVAKSVSAKVNIFS